MTLYVDERWAGHHGIARFASQVLPRLAMDSLPITGSHPLGLRSLVPALGLRRTDSVYSPGFNATISRARQLVTIHDLIHLDWPTEASAAKRLYYEHVVRPAVLRAGLVHTVSEYSRVRIQDWLSTPEVSVVNVGNGVSGVFCNAGPVEELEVGTFIYVGNLKPHKNARVIFEALRLRPNYRVVFVTADREAVRQTASELDVGDRVGLLSGISDARLASLYRSSAGLLFPSLMEGFGLPPLEAMLSGCRVAYSSDCLAAREVLGTAGNAVADARSPQAWALTMDSIVEEDRQMAKTSPSFSARDLSWDAVGTEVRKSLQNWTLQ